MTTGGEYIGDCFSNSVYTDSYGYSWGNDAGNGMSHSGNGNEQANAPAPNPTTVVNSVMPGLPAQMPASSGNANTGAQGWYENYQNMGWSSGSIASRSNDTQQQRAATAD
jgi:hypothetical protein